IHRLVPWIVAVLVAVGSAAMTLKYSEDRIEKLESWQAAHATSQHSNTVRDIAILRVELDAIHRGRSEQTAKSDIIANQLRKLTRTVDALCAADMRCRPGD
ncbi:hypothetical protein LCGC14_2739270, partial [marine sediment metagenome]